MMDIRARMWLDILAFVGLVAICAILAVGIWTMFV